MAWFGDPSDDDKPVNILVVCIGNICRSPLAEQLLRAKVGDRFTLASAGLYAVQDQPMDPMSAQRSLRYGGDPTGALGDQFTEEHAKWADLILTMTESQRNELVQRHPRASLRTFTIAEFARLAEATSEGDPAPRKRIERATRNRGMIRLGSADDVVDPIGASAEVHDQVATQIVNYVDRIAQILT